MLTTAQRKSGRVKVACINWTHDDAPHAMSYVLIDGGAEFSVYHATWAMAMDRAEVLARTFNEGVADDGE